MLNIVINNKIVGKVKKERIMEYELQLEKEKTEKLEQELKLHKKNFIDYTHQLVTLIAQANYYKLSVSYLIRDEEDYFININGNNFRYKDGDIYTIKRAISNLENLLHGYNWVYKEA